MSDATTIKLDETIDGTRAAELLDDPSKMEPVLKAFGEQLLVDLEAGGMPCHADVRTFAEAGLPGQHGLVLTDTERRLEYAISQPNTLR